MHVAANDPNKDCSRPNRRDRRDQTEFYQVYESCWTSIDCASGKAVVSTCLRRGETKQNSAALFFLLSRKTISRRLCCVGLITRDDEVTTAALPNPHQERNKREKKNHREITYAPNLLLRRGKKEGRKEGKGKSPKDPR